jgi:hypothetical protein
MTLRDESPALGGNPAHVYTPPGRNSPLAHAALWLVCFPLFALFALTYLPTKSPSVPAFWITDGIQSPDLIAAPLLAIPLLWFLARCDLVVIRNQKGWTWPVKCFIVAASLHTLLAVAIRVGDGFTISHDLPITVSPDQRWAARAHVSHWLDTSYYLYVERRLLPLRAYRAGDTSGVMITSSRDIAVAWSPDSRYAVVRVAGIPVCAYDTQGQMEVNLRRNPKLFEPSPPPALDP